MQRLLGIVFKLHRDESGQDLIEYALVAALIAFAAVAGMNFVAASINNAFSTIGNKLQQRDLVATAMMYFALAFYRRTRRAGSPEGVFG
jgi:pilus assembly protein Flp/PilA